MTEFEITQGDHGQPYVGVIPNENMSSYTAKIYVWTDADAMIVDGKSCTVAFESPDTHVTYIPAEEDFAAVTPGAYRGVFVLTASGVKEHLKPFMIRVLPKPPGT
jgi:hypothetical protein